MNLNRRSFLKQSGLLAAGAAGLPYFVRSSALGADGTVAPSNRITMGAIERPGAWVACLPNRVFLRVLGTDASTDALTY